MTNPVMLLPTPHLDKLNAAIANDKTPPEDKARLQSAKEQYHLWIESLDSVQAPSPAEVLREKVSLLDGYRTFVDLQLIFDSPHDFLYRQAGQLKLNNSVIEEFLPHLIRRDILPEIEGFNVEVGPAKCFSAVHFSTSLEMPTIGGGFDVRDKAQDFAISKRLYLKASHSPDFPAAGSVSRTTSIGYVVAECKTNLDKTMFQEACATAHDVKAAVSGARYFMLAEWLDMTPLSTAPTDIDEILLIRKAKRTQSGVRRLYSGAAGRSRGRVAYEKYLVENPFRPEVFERFVTHIRGILKSEAPIERDVLSRGYF